MNEVANVPSEATPTPAATVCCSTLTVTGEQPELPQNPRPYTRSCCPEATASGEICRDGAAARATMGTEDSVAQRTASPPASVLIGSQRRGACEASPFPHSPFEPCVRFSRTRLTDGLLSMVTLPPDSGWFRAIDTSPAVETSHSSRDQHDQHGGCDRAAAPRSVAAVSTRSRRSG